MSRRESEFSEKTCLWKFGQNLLPLDCSVQQHPTKPFRKCFRVILSTYRGTYYRRKKAGRKVIKNKRLRASTKWKAATTTSPSTTRTKNRRTSSSRSHARKTQRSVQTLARRQLSNQPSTSFETGRFFARCCCCRFLLEFQLRDGLYSAGILGYC